MIPDLTTHPAFRQLRQAVAELTLISHVSGVSYEGKAPASTSEDIGGKRPPGTDRDRPARNATLDERMSWMASYQRRTPDYFARELESCQSEQRLIALRDEARETVEAWRRCPLPAGQEPLSMSDPNWKRWVAECTLDGGEIARRYGTTRQYVHQVRRAWRVDEAA